MLFTLFVLGSVLLFLVKTVNNKLNNPQDTPFGTNDTEPQEEFKEEFKEEPQVEPQEKPQEKVQEPVIIIQDTPQEKAQPKQSYSSYGHLFGLIGKPLGHSTSKDRFNKMFREQHINAYYENFELDSIEQVKDMVDRNPNLCGFNVTIPYKEDIIPYLTRLDETAQAIGAVNTVKVIHKESGTELIGYNTDWIGFTESFKELIEGHSKALILGTGGVSKAVKYALDRMGIENKFVSRNSTFDIMGYYELSPSIMDEYDIIVNCTPLGMWPNTDQCPDIPYTFLSDKHVLLDVIANPDETMFMKKGRDHGAQAKGGKDMLEQQAVAAWNIWERIGE
ncbi:MAG: shikimate dehydrogenase [Bacteroidaceae bacterium]|nr:shikimate dehydrogenase [Bacteroidaceae bacterium]